jgi:hypothetical protein
MRTLQRYSNACHSTRGFSETGFPLHPRLRAVYTQARSASLQTVVLGPGARKPAPTPLNVTLTAPVRSVPRISTDLLFRKPKGIAISHALRTAGNRPLARAVQRNRRRNTAASERSFCHRHRRRAGLPHRPGRSSSGRLFGSQLQIAMLPPNTKTVVISDASLLFHQRLGHEPSV